MSDIFNISASNNFVETLADKLLQEYKNSPLNLANVTIFLPNRRACISLAEAFIRLQGMKPSLLPQMQAIGDIKEDELLLSGTDSADTFVTVPPAINPVERKLIFMKLILSRYSEFGLEKISLSQAYLLAEELGALIDKVCLQELSWDNLKNIVPDEYAFHWQETLKFLNIVTAYWPEILKERGVIDSGTRKNNLIKKQCELWQKTKPSQHIIIAGTTAVSPAMKLFVKTVLDLNHGEVFLSGLDKYLEDDAWQKIDETHPQYELKQLLDYLQIDRSRVKDLCPPQNPEREKFISEIMRPAVCSDQWRNLNNKISATAVSGLKIVECKDTRSEALTISVLIRKCLETPEKTIALVTPDRNLARRTSNELLRWNIKIDDSAGLPLAQTNWGIFMRLLIAASSPNALKKEILSLCKTSLFLTTSFFNNTENLIRRLEKNFWRQEQNDEEAKVFLDDIYQKLADFRAILSEKTQSLKQILITHITTAEKISSSLWQNDDGAAGSLFLSDWMEKAEILEEINPSDYLNFFEAMMTGQTIHPKQTSHPRIKILGPMEARLNHYDEIILGGFNEGIWPITPDADPWMSRPMKKNFGFELPEKQIGVLGLDFANLLGAKTVYITRADNQDGSPTVKSRWLMRLETVLQALGISKDLIQEKDCLHWAEELNKPSTIKPIDSPAPTPPVSLRPRKLSASAVEKLIRDPYSVFAKYILKLTPLDELDQEESAIDFGNLVHQILEDFGRLYPEKYPENAESILLEMGHIAFSKSSFSAEKQAFWQPKFNKIISWIVAYEKQYRQNIKHIHTEIWGNYIIDNAPAGPFEIYAKADRVDETSDGQINIIDYKTGRGRKKKEVKAGYAPQLPIEGIIAANGGFDHVKAAPVNDLMYWRLGNETITINAKEDNVLDHVKENIIRLINSFDFESTPYLCNPNPKHASDYSDYEHLARVKEWSVISEEEE